VCIYRLDAAGSEMVRKKSEISLAYIEYAENGRFIPAATE